MRFDIAHRVISKITHQPAIEAGHGVQLGHIELAMNFLDGFQGIIGVLAMDLLSVLLDQQQIGLNPNHCRARQPDDRVAAPFLTALNRFKQVTVGALCHFQIGADRGFQIGQHLAV